MRAAIFGSSTDLDFYFDLQIPNRDLMVLARIGDHETLYKYRNDLDRIGYLSFLQLRGFATEYDLRIGDLAVPTGLLADRRIITPGAIALYVALTALASPNRASDEPYGTSCQFSSRQLLDAARFSSRGQLRRYRSEIEDIGLIKVTRTPGRPPNYHLALNEMAQVKLDNDLVFRG